MQEQSYQVLAYYRFVHLRDPHEEVLRHKCFFGGRNVRGRIYISEDGINGQVSASEADAEAYKAWMWERDPFHDMEFKMSRYHENVFPRMTVKYREQLVALDLDVDPSKGGEHVSPKQWREMLESEEEHLILDVRNDYEWELGHFRGAELPTLANFREFPEYAEDLKSRRDPKTTKVMMYCTGGIRCELYSALLKEKGFENVYQLDGGVIKYGEEEGSKHWDGKLFVFDDRMAVPVGKEETQVIAKCRHCGESSEKHYNCANMDCNELFFSCGPCLKNTEGCCCETCKDAPRRRSYSEMTTRRPFRRKHFVELAK